VGIQANGQADGGAKQGAGADANDAGLGKRIPEYCLAGSTSDCQESAYQTTQGSPGQPDPEDYFPDRGIRRTACETDRPGNRLQCVAWIKLDGPDEERHQASRRQ
jgi:hypothetical protein